VNSENLITHQLCANPSELTTIK